MTPQPSKYFINLLGILNGDWFVTMTLAISCGYMFFRVDAETS